MEVDYKLIGERIKEGRKRKRWSQERLAEEMDLTDVYISRIERGAQTNLKRLVQIANVLEIPFEYLITGTVPKTPNYLDRELYEILMKCTPAKQRLIYSIAKIVATANFV